MAEYIENLISVIVPVYNTGKYVGECLDSIINQTYKKLEIIVIDDGSIDNSYNVCKEYLKKDDRIVLIHQENKGLITTRKVGISHATGEFIAFVDSDDYIENTMYEDMLNEKGDTDLVSCAIIRHVSEEKENDAVVHRKDLFDKKICCDENFYSRMIYDFESNILFRMSPNIVNKLFLHSKVDKFYEKLNEEIFNGEDVLFSTNYMLQCSSISCIDKPLYHYRFRNDSCVHNIRENELYNVNKLYLALKGMFEGHELSQILLKQFQKYIQNYTCQALNRFMGFDKDIRIQKYIIDTNGLKNKKIAIYGFGEIGQDIFLQLKKFGYEVVVIVDKNYQYYQSKGMNVFAIEKLLDCDYDAMIIAVKNDNTKIEIKSSLQRLGVDNKKIAETKIIEIF